MRGRREIVHPGRFPSTRVGESTIYPRDRTENVTTVPNGQLSQEDEVSLVIVTAT